MRNAGMTNAKPAILLMIRKLPKPMLSRRVTASGKRFPELQEPFRRRLICKLLDSFPTIRASLEEVEQTLISSVALVIVGGVFTPALGHATVLFPPLRCRFR
ncbi:hypothetical protein ACLK1T_23685 [Escherichia coli]